MSPIINILTSISFVNSFYFAAIVAADHLLPTFADINLIKTTQFDRSPLLEYFDHNNIKYIHTQNICFM